MIRELYSPSLTLLTDLYQITMGYGYWRNQMHDRRAVFHLFFRHCPFGGQYAIAAGLGPVVDWLTNFHVTQEDVDFLRSLRGNDDKVLFSDDFLAAILGMKLSVDIDAMPEGTIAFSHQPLIRIAGPLWQCQWIETALLNIVNFQTLIATKSARVCDAAMGDSVLEFGLRRAQGIDGSISASRAAFIGGCNATSNVLAGKLLNIPVKGTHAHSWVMSFGDELSAFEAYAKAMPNNCVFLVDTYDTLEGVEHAIIVGKKLRESGHQMVGIRLDSGDLAELSIQARRLLDDAGFEQSVIVASNDLDEYEILKLKTLNSTIAVWGVGTNLVTARDQPALGGVYKLGAIEDEQGAWQPRIKLSEQPIKTSNPGIHQIRRFQRDATMVGDVMYSETIGPPESNQAVTFDDQPFAVDDEAESTDLLQPVLRDGQLVTKLPSLNEIQSHASNQRALLPPQTRAIENSSPYPSGLEPRLAQLKQEMIQAAS